MLDINNKCKEFASITLEVLDSIIDRCDKDPAYPFLDTKINIITGENIYPPAPDKPYNAKDIIFSWIQGRGLEALAGHARWLQTSPNDESFRIEKIRGIMVTLVEKMEDIRSKNNGRMYFIMNTAGEFLEVAEDGSLVKADQVRAGANYSDLFYSKGLMAAAEFLNKPDLLADAEKYFERVLDDIRSGRFASDQQSFDPKNKVAFVEGKMLQGPWMISLDGIALAAQFCNKEKWLGIAREVITYIFQNHINTGQISQLQKYDFWEAIDVDGQPWKENGQLFCDPGHALEFVGLSMKCVLQMLDDRNMDTVKFIEYCKLHIPEVLRHCFELGFAAGPGGIIKAFDLVDRKAINTDMPWWSLPETIRAAAEVYKLTGDDYAVEVFQKCADAFLNNYINKEVYSMAYQTRDSQGNPVEVVPATPDADPGYHTGLSLIDAIRCAE